MARPAPSRQFPSRLAELAVDYSRYSTDKQGSTAEQMQVNEELAHEAGIAIVARFYDEGISRSIADRPGLQDMFAYLEGHPEVGYIIVNELERMTAGIDQRQVVTRLCKKARITILTEDMGLIDPHDEKKMQEADERAVTSKGEVIKVSQRVRRSLRAKVRNGTSVAMRPPYGIRMKPLIGPDGKPLPSGVAYLDASSGKKITSGEIELHPDEHEWLVQIFEWADEGLALAEIQRRLLAAGVPTKTGKGKWDTTTIGGILDNPIYKGVMIWGARRTLRDEDTHAYQEFREDDDPARIVMDSPLGAIVDPELWERVQQRRATRPPTRMSKRRSQDPQALDHYVFCGRCGHKMYPRADTTKNGFSWRYICLSSYASMNAKVYPEYGELCTSSHSMSLKDILAAMAGAPGYGGRELPVFARRETSREERTLASERRRLMATIAKVKEEEERAVDLAVEGLINKQKLTEIKVRLAAERNKAEEKLVDLGPVEAPQVQPIRGEWKLRAVDLAERLADTTAPVELRRQYISDAKLEAIYVDKPTLTLRFRQ